MASTLVRLPASGRVMKDAEVHHVPAKISLDGPAPVSTYFLPAVAEADDKPAAGKSATTGSPTARPSGAANAGGAEKTAFLRGRALDGVVARLPKGMVGVVVSEAHFADLSSSRAAAEDSDSSDDEAHDCGGGGGGIDDDGPWDAALQVDATFSSLSVW